MVPTTNNKQFGACNFSNKLLTPTAIGNDQGDAIWQKGEKNHIEMAEELNKMLCSYANLWFAVHLSSYIFSFHSDNSFYKFFSFSILNESNNFFSMFVSLPFSLTLFYFTELHCCQQKYAHSIYLCILINLYILI